jgi:hypothetical protein
MRKAKLIAGILVGIALVASSIVRIPKLIERSGGSSYDQSFLFGTIGSTLLLAALSAWLIIGGLKREPSDRDHNRQ